MKKIYSLLVVLCVVFSCNESKKEASIKNSEVNKLEVAANYKNLEVKIKGMTCEIGCARTIQSKISKVDGVSYAKVSFKSKKGQFTYDTNKVSKKDLVNKINGIAGGDLYTVTNTEEIQKITK